MLNLKDKKILSNIYYSPKGYWKGLSAVEKLTKSSGLTKDKVKTWLEKQAIWQVYLPPPKNIPRPKFDVTKPNEVHQADLLFLPHDRPGRGRKLYKYALTIVDVASRYKEAEPLASKQAKEVAAALSKIYERSPLNFPNLLQVDPGLEFEGQFKQLLNKKGVSIRQGRVEIHRDQGIVERFNRTLAERLFGYQQAQEFLMDSNERSRKWVNRLPEVIFALNNEVTRLTGKKPIEAIKSKMIKSKASIISKRRVGLDEERLPDDVNVRYLYQPGELEGGDRRRATDAIWSLNIYTISSAVAKSNTPIVYYLEYGPKRGFVREELLIIPYDTELPPDTIL